MRAFVLATLLVLALVPTPGASAKGFMEDAAGDTSTRVLGGMDAPAASPGSESIDLLSLDVSEDAESLTFTLALTNLRQQVNFAEYTIGFSWGKSEYEVIVERMVAPPLFEDRSEAYLIDREEARWDALAALDHTLDLDQNLITVHLPKAYILSESGRYPLLGDTLRDLYVEAQSHMTIFQFSASAYDRMPDGEETKAYPFAFGDVAAGHLRLDANDRVRVSNGGATTFVYQTTVKNTGEIDDEVRLGLSEMPEGWNGSVLSPVRVPAGAERTIAILVSVPFAHDHGGFSSFNVTATSARDPASGASIRLGVLHTPIPQPAGHHSDLFLHAKSFNGGVFSRVFPFAEASINTEASHEGDVAEASPSGGGDEIVWHLPLAPSLRMGLDFDLDRDGEIVGSIVGHNKFTGTLSAELWLTTMDEESDGLLLAESDEAEAILDVSAPTPFKLTLVPTLDADYVPYAKGQNLLLKIAFASSDEPFGSICCIPGAAPGLRTEDFKLTLPLNEYHDRLTGLSISASALELRAEGEVEKAGLPGSILTYAFTLVNPGSRETIAIDLAGTDAGLASIVPEGSVTLGPGETKKITVAVEIPLGKNEGEELEVLVFAYAQADPSKSAIARTKTIVARTGSADIVGDETGVLLAARQAESNDTPAPGVVAMVALVALAALVLRRRVK